MWTIEYEGNSFGRFLVSLPKYEQVVLVSAIDFVLRIQGISVCSGEWGKPLGRGLYEFRVRKSLRAILPESELRNFADLPVDRTVLFRVFCTFYGDRIVLLLHGYDKKKDPSVKRQQKEIAKARRLLERWKDTRGS